MKSSGTIVALGNPIDDMTLEKDFIGNYCESNCRFMVLGTLVLASMIMIGLKFYIGWRMKNWISKD